MNIRSGWALAALVVGWFAPSAMAVPADPRAIDARPVDKVIAITESDQLAIRSYFQRRVEKPPGQDAAHKSQLWGLTAESALPVSAARAHLEYSVWVPEGLGQQHGLVDSDNRFVRLRFNDQRRHFNYGANVFSVGEAFVQNPIARARVDAAGLPGPGDGSEIWLAGRVPKLGLMPRFRRLEKTQGDMNLVNETYGLAFDHRLGNMTRLMYLLESSEATMWFDRTAGAGNGRESAVATVRMQRDGWNLFIKNGVFDQQFAAGRAESGRLWEAGGTLDVLYGLTLCPLFTGQSREVGTDDLKTTTAGLTVQTRWLDPVAVNLNLQSNRRDNPDGSTFQGTTADLNLRAPLRLREGSPGNLLMTASVGYRAMEGLHQPVAEEGMSFRVTVDFHPGL